ncbi:MAG: hypothetical protein N3D84_02185 [Candidatus Woesearchaeota archaeon]|nr:hypothetical protein [Candidatus Woesearchaeota archaeon]
MKRLQIKIHQVKKILQIKFLKSKKAQEGEGVIIPSKMILYLVIAIVVPLLGLFFVSLALGYKAQINSYLDDVEDIMLESRFVNSPECFVYVDKDTGRAYPGLIDPAKFTQERMDYCYDVDPDFENGCFRLELKRLDTEASSIILESKNYAKCIAKETEKEAKYVIFGNAPAVLYIESIKR